MFRLLYALARLVVALAQGLRALPRMAAVALGAASADTPARPRRLWQSMGIILPIAFAAGWLLPKINLVMTPSVPAFAVIEAAGPIARGDYVRFTLSHPVAGPVPVSVTKFALCLPGDRLTMIETPDNSDKGAYDGHYFCNGAELGVSMPQTENGVELTHMRWSGIIPPGRYYVGSRHPRGFDSRYIGLIPAARLTRMERLL